MLSYLFLDFPKFYKKDDHLPEQDRNGDDCRRRHENETRSDRVSREGHPWSLGRSKITIDRCVLEDAAVSIFCSLVF